MQYQCPHCSSGIRLQPKAVEIIKALPHFACPACGGLVPAHPSAAPVAHANPAQSVASSSPSKERAKPAPRSRIRALGEGLRHLNRRTLILGTAVLLMLGGVAIFFATRDNGDRTVLNQDITNDILKNKYFTDLIASGTTTKDLLRKVERIEPQGAGFIGISREALTWDKAVEFARATGSRLLAVESPSENRGPWDDPTMQRLVSFLEAKFPASVTSTLWVMQNSSPQPRVFHAPDVSTVTTPEHPRKALLDWRPLPAKHEDKSPPLPPPPPKNNNPVDIELLSIDAPVDVSADKKITIRAKAGEKFKVNVTAWYRTPVPTKLASNLLMAKANILPPDLLQELQRNHSTTWHFDTQSRAGYQAVSGEGTITFDMTSYAPKKGGSFTFDMNLGLFDKQTWATQVLKLYPVTLIVSDP